MGGAERVVCDLADGLSNRGHAVTLIYLTGGVFLAPKNDRVRLIGVEMNSGMDLPRAFLKIKKIISGINPDVVHSHMVHANILTRLIRLVVPIKRLISTAHSSNEGGIIRMLAYRLTDRLADISTNVSREAVKIFEEKKAVKKGRMIPVHNAISVNKFSFNSAARSSIRAQLNLDDDCKLLLSVGRLHEAKDYPNLFKALVILKKNGFAGKACIVGEGSLRSELEEMAVALNLSDIVVFKGIRHDIPDLMSAADLFVFPSAWEGFGLVVAEAMACERVVVATDCGGVREIVGDLGYLVPPKNSAALADAITRALGLNLAVAAEMGKSARLQVIDKFSSDQSEERWLKIYAGHFH